MMQKSYQNVYQVEARPPVYLHHLPESAGLACHLYGSAVGGRTQALPFPGFCLLRFRIERMG